MVPYSAQLMKRLDIKVTFGKSFKDVCYIVSRSLSSAILTLFSMGEGGTMAPYRFSYAASKRFAVGR